MTTEPGEALLVRGAHVLACDEDGTEGLLDLRLEGGRIVEVGDGLAEAGARVLDARGLVAIPGLVQAHLHLCQTLMRNRADGLDLLSWLRERIWPLEGALTADELRAGARLGMAELLLSGTTTVLDVGTVRYGDVLFEEAERLGLRYAGGKVIMDVGQGYPAGLRETSADAVAESVRLCERWHGAAGGRLRYAFSPRFVLSCSEATLRACVREARARGALLQTHAAENTEEVALVRERTGRGNVEYLHELGFSGPDVLLAHGIWLSAEERRILRETRTTLVHCPSSNLKLGSGIARVPELLEEGVSLALGTDGAACSDGLDLFAEIRLAALLHRARFGAQAMSARAALALATREGARALGLADAGVLACEKRADLVLLDLHKPHAVPAGDDLTGRVVFSARASDVHTVIVDGKVVVREGELLTADVDAVMREAESAAAALAERALGG
jgi:5-methylthioadenosine/S-adenosylhomocysteine deaminase